MKDIVTFCDQTIGVTAKSMRKFYNSANLKSVTT